MSYIMFGTPGGVGNYSAAKTPSVSADSMWSLLRELNAAKVNKEALDNAIEEEESIIELLHRVDAFVQGSPQGRTRSEFGPPISSQLAAFRFIDEETQRIYNEIDRINQKKRDESKELSDAEGIGMSLALHLKATSAGSSDQLLHMQTHSLPLSELRSSVEVKRNSCLKWLNEQQSLSARVSELRAQNLQLERECADIRDRTGSLDSRQSLLQDITKMEASIDTLVKLLSIAPSPVRSSRR
ncbi:Hypothetical protein, putative [Bodo saltans]|uniref:Uncharacterized protein n=1 Tax=Bodo saltans TaxID=75058 RepID=A0A0S4IR75_BODSA|nr:Hypothetical protein, putative [Bodo saltans]|eukprot:CUE73120.1 Hypothetical protein, putative [Bodo saltans]